MTNESYSVAALAAAVGVPRTTINDWLSRYADYIEAETQGRRRMFSAKSVTVLKTVAQLRDAGKNSTEIEAELAAMFGIHPEVTTPEQKLVEEKTVASESELEINEDNGEAQLPALRKLEQNAMELAAFLADMQQKEVRAGRRARWMIGLLCILILLLLATGAGGYMVVTGFKMHLAERSAENRALQDNIEAMQKEFARSVKAMNEQRQAEADKAQRQILALQKDLQLTNQARAAELKKLETQLVAERKNWQARLARQEKEFARLSAAERQSWLAKVTAANAEAAGKIEVLQNKIIAAETELRNLSSQVAAQAAAPAVVATPQKPAPEATPVQETVPATVEKSEKE